MKPSEAATLLTLAATFDRRTIGETDAHAWADALDGLTPADCAEAIRAHYRDSTEWLMPAHIRTTVRRLRDTRIRADLTDPPYDRDDIQGGLNAIRSHRRALADGQPPAKQKAINPDGTDNVNNFMRDAARHHALPPAHPTKHQEQQ